MCEGREWVRKGRGGTVRAGEIFQIILDFLHCGLGRDVTDDDENKVLGDVVAGVIAHQIGACQTADITCRPPIGPGVGGSAVQCFLQVAVSDLEQVRVTAVDRIQHLRTRVRDDTGIEISILQGVSQQEDCMRILIFDR